VRYANRRDANEREIVAALERAGALVLQLDRFDFLVYFRGRLLMMDAKMPHGRATAAQERLSLLGWPSTMSTTPTRRSGPLGRSHEATTCPRALGRWA